MTGQFPAWQVQQPRLAVSARVLAIPAGIVLLLIAVIHTSAMIIGGLIALPVIAVIFLGWFWVERADGAGRLAGAPSGTLVACMGSTRLEALRGTPRFAEMAGGLRGKVASGTVTIDGQGIRLALQRRRSGGRPTIAVAWSEVVGVRAYMVPGKLNVGNIELTLGDGAQLRFQVSGYSRLVKALDGLRGQSIVGASVSP